MGDAIRVVLDVRHRDALGTRLALAQRMLAVGAQLRDHPVLDRGDHAAVRFADAAERDLLFSGHHAPPYRGRPSRSTPSGRRSSSASLSRWAASVTAAAGRSTCGHVGPCPVEQIVGLAEPVVERGDQQALALEPVVAVLLELRVRLADRRPVARADEVQVEPQQPVQRREVAAQGARIGRDVDAAVAEHGVAAEEDPAGDEGQMIGRVPGRRDHRERPERPRRRRAGPSRPATWPRRPGSPRAAPATPRRHRCGRRARA